mgnify:CR=1|tara:strand:- start:211 stop:477 length:267 start_codon:yes stop_codon:yes gene_type:complete
MTVAARFCYRKSENEFNGFEWSIVILVAPAPLPAFFTFTIVVIIIIVVAVPAFTMPHAQPSGTNYGLLIFSVPDIRYRHFLNRSLSMA